MSDGDPQFGRRYLRIRSVKAKTKNFIIELELILSYFTELTLALRNLIN